MNIDEPKSTEHHSPPPSASSFPDQSSECQNEDFIDPNMKARADLLKLRIAKYYESLRIQYNERQERYISKITEKFYFLCLSLFAVLYREKRLEAALENCPSAEGKAALIEEYQRKEHDFLRFKRTRMSPDHFTTIRVIGRGAFGTVKLVQSKETGKLFALKVLSKSVMLANDQLAHVRAERDLLVQSHSQWVVQLHCSFQDAHHLYLLMEYLPGGDMMSLLIREDVFSEDMARFYLAECVLAIQSVHSLNYIHRYRDIFTPSLQLY